MAQGQFVAEVIDDGMAYGKDAESRLQSIASLLTGGGTLPIGAIEWSVGGDPSLPAVTGIASPLLPYLGQIPLIGEHVLIFTGTTTDNNDSTAAEAYYYIGPLQIDGSKNYNGLQGYFKRTGLPSPTIPKPLVPAFAKKKVDALQPLFGDTIIQDRNGSCIRMSSTQLASALRYMDGTVSGQIPYKPTGTPRAKKGPLFIPAAAGNPIMLLTVGLPGQKTKSLSSLAKGIGTSATLIENPDADQSIIYLTSDQQLVYRMTRSFAHNNNKQPNTGGKILKNDLYRDNNKNFIYDSAATGVSDGTRFNKGSGEKGLKNPAFGRALFVQPNAYPSTSAARSQILIRSHRLMFDAQFDSILMCALKDIKMGTTNWRVELDSTMGLIEELMKQVGLMCQHIQDLGIGMKDHIGINQRVQYPTGVGPTGPCLNTYDKSYEGMKTKIGGTNTEGTFLNAVKGRIEALDVILENFQKMRRTETEKKKKNKSK